MSSQKRSFIKIGLLSLSILIFNNCSDSTNDNNDDIDSTEITITQASTSTNSPEGDVNNTATDEDDLLENATFEHDVSITFNGDSFEVNNPLENNGVEITQEDGQIVINSSESKVAYSISGETSTYALKIYSEKKLKLNLNDIQINSPSGPAINIQTSKTIFVNLVDGSSNQLSDSDDYSIIPDEEDAKAAFFSEGQLIFSGNGSLTVAGKYKHGIASDDYIRFISGTLTISEAVKDGIHVNDYFVGDGGTLNLSANSDGLDVEEGFIVINAGTYNCTVADDGIVASYSIEDESEPDASISPYVTINGGHFNITTTEGEGIESKSILTINDGVFDIHTYDDGLNAANGIYINGGKLYVVAEHNDAIDSNGLLTVTGGLTIAIGSGQPEAGFDNDNFTFKITGGTLLGLGGSTSLPTTSVSTQPSIILGGFDKDKILHIRTNENEEVLTYLVPISYSTMLYSSPKIQTGKSYSIYTSGTVSDGKNYNGLYYSGTYYNGNATSTSFDLSSMVTQLGGSIGPGGGPGGFR